MIPRPKIIVGLGNPGKSYEKTRHNVGFMILDRLAARRGVQFRVDKQRRAQLASCFGVLLVKPLTFMNESGMSVGPLAHFFKIKPEEVFAIYDEIAFSLGEIKLREGGSAAGHNGMKSLIAHLGTNDFPRLRFGIGSPCGQGEMIGHVLGSFRPDEKEIFAATLERAVDAVECILDRDFSTAANQYNVKV